MVRPQLWAISGFSGIGFRGHACSGYSRSGSTLLAATPCLHGLPRNATTSTIPTTVRVLPTIPLWLAGRCPHPHSSRCPHPHSSSQSEAQMFPLRQDWDLSFERQRRLVVQLRDTRHEMRRLWQIRTHCYYLPKQQIFSYSLYVPLVFSRGSQHSGFRLYAQCLVHFVSPGECHSHFSSSFSRY